MSAFSTYIIILIIVYIVYYAVAILRELSNSHGKGYTINETEAEITPESVFGFKEVYVSDGLYKDDTFDVSEDYIPAQDNTFYEELKRQAEEYFPSIPDYQEDMDSKEFSAATDEPVVEEEEYSADQEFYDEELFSAVFPQKLEKTTHVVRKEIVAPEPTRFDLERWLRYSQVGFKFDTNYRYLLICLYINRREYEKKMGAEDIRDIMDVSDEGKIISDISSWWKRQDLAVKYFRDEIISEHEMVEGIPTYGLGREVPFNPMPFDIRNIPVTNLWFEISDCHVIRTGFGTYGILASIKDGPILTAKISDDDLDIYLEKDLEGHYRKNIPPESLMVKYLLSHISRDYPKHEGIVEEVDGYELTGEPPVFMYDENFCLSDEKKSEALLETRILCVKDGGWRRYYLETSIYGIHRAVMLKSEEVSKILEINERLEFTRNITPEDVAGFYWGHEFKYLKNGCVPEPPRLLIDILKDGVALPEEYDVVDYPKTDYFSVLQIKKKYVRIYQEKNEDELPGHYVYNLVIRIGSSGFWYRLTINDICNYLERDECGRFTRRVSIEQLASGHIKMYAGMVKMYKAGVPQTVIIKATGVSKHYIRKIISNLALKKPRTHLSELKAAKRQQIREDFANGVDLTDLRFKYGLKEYKTLYKLLGSMVSGQNAVVPSEFKEFVKITTPEV